MAPLEEVWMCVRAPGWYFLECVCVGGRVSAVGLRPILTTRLGASDGFQERIYQTSEKSEKQSRGNRPGFWCNLILLSRFLHPSLVPSILEGTTVTGILQLWLLQQRVLGKRW